MPRLMRSTSSKDDVLWFTVERLPKYAPELTDIEGVWRDLKAHHLAHQRFADADALDTAIHDAVAALHAGRSRDAALCKSLLSSPPALRPTHWE